ncbi:hypothetical protein [Marinoscillum furvescens]|uniref:Uncharacterized protein n=1 Tax=Marinoscillum furvescens DSM 4134 TaxID=1122208 RepID=A0A3D9LGL9_MARFU|nr:hypothetical protein [Marinoscillum furvescens]REE05840.1 hypothetical protein C7460_101359 [Marinoscillum furvescens DSM 4134]
MRFAPVMRHTLVSGLSCAEVLYQIEQSTQVIDDEYITENARFNGRFFNASFRISPKIRTPQNAVPLLVGKVEDTSRGSIIFLTIRLFPAGVLYLKVSTLLCMLVGMIFLLLSPQFSNACIAFGLGIINYLILYVNFRMRAQQAVSDLEEILAQVGE